MKQISILAFTVALLAAATAHGDIFFVDNINDQTTRIVNSDGSVRLPPYFATLSSAQPEGLAFDTAGNLYEADLNSGSIFRFTPSGVKSTFASGLNSPTGLAFDNLGNLFVASLNDAIISKITPSGTVTPFAFTQNSPFGLAIDSGNNVYVANYGSNTVGKISLAGIYSIFVDATHGLSNPFGLAFDTSGNLFVSNSAGGCKINKVTPSGTVTVFATEDAFDSLRGLAFDSGGDLYVTKPGSSSSSIDRITPSGTITPFTTVGLNAPNFIAVQPIPEPSSLILFGIGVVCIIRHRTMRFRQEFRRAALLVVRFSSVRLL